eukprot:scaffold659_cov192-Ochromonas_danica.AAC.55
MVDSTFQHPAYTFSAAQNAILFQVVLSHRPSSQDVETNCYYFTGLGSAWIILAKTNPNAASEQAAKVFDVLLHGCEAEFTQVHIASCGTMKRMIQHILSAKWIGDLQIPPNNGEKTHLTLYPRGKLSSDLKLCYDIIATLEKLLQFRLQLSWNYALDVIRAYFSIFKGHPHRFFFTAPLISKVGEIVQGIVSGAVSLDTSIHTSLLDTVSAGLHAVGLADFLHLLPIVDNVVAKMDLVNQLKSREWIIEVLQSELKHMYCKLSDFVTALLPIAGRFHKLLTDPNNSLGLNEIQSKVVRNRVLQIWSLFAEVCYNKPVDLLISFPRMQPILKQTLEDKDYPEIIFSTMVALGRLVQVVLGDNEKDSTVMAAYPQEQAMLSSEASVYLPLLLKYSETLPYGDGKFKEALHTISLWVKLAPPALVSQISKKLLKLVLTTTNVASTGQSGEGYDSAAVWMATLLAIMPALPPNMIELVYKTVRPMLSVDESLALQKSSYSLLHAMITHHVKILFQYEAPLDLLQLISNSLLNAHISSRNMRLKCISALLEHLQDMEQLQIALKMTLREALICQKDANKKCREGAVAILKIFSTQLPAILVFKAFAEVVAEESTLLTASALNALSLLLLEQNKLYYIAAKLGNNNNNNNKDKKKRSHSMVEPEDDEEEDEDDDSEGDEDDDDSVKVPSAFSLADYDEFQRMAAAMLPSISLLLSQDSAEQTKACLGYLKVVATVLLNDLLKPVAPQIVHSTCLEVGAHLKEKFATRVRAIIRKLHRKLDDEDSLRAMLPPSDLPLLEYIARQNRKDLKKKLLRQAEVAKRSQYDRMLGSDSDDDSDDENGGGDDEEKDHNDEDYRLVSGRKFKAIRAQGTGFASLLPSVLDSLLQGEDLSAGVNNQGQPVDLRMSASKPTSHHSHGKVTNAKRGKDALDEIDGPLAANAADQDEEEAFQVVVSQDGKVVIKQKEVKKKVVAEEDQATPAPAPADGTTQYRERANKKRKVLNLKEPGAEYRAKNAGGDVWKKGTPLQPHAYIPLDPRLLSKKHHDQAVKHFAVVVDSNKKNKQFGGRRRVVAKRK